MSSTEKELQRVGDAGGEWFFLPLIYLHLWGTELCTAAKASSSRHFNPCGVLFPSPPGTQPFFVPSRCFLLIHEALVFGSWSPTCKKLFSLVTPSKESRFWMKKVRENCWTVERDFKIIRHKAERAMACSLRLSLLRSDCT